jgi:hypothetical protein
MNDDARTPTRCNAHTCARARARAHVCAHASAPPVSGDRGLRLVSTRQFSESEDTPRELEGGKGKEGRDSGWKGIKEEGGERGRGNEEGEEQGWRTAIGEESTVGWGTGVCGAAGGWGGGSRQRRFFWTTPEAPTEHPSCRAARGTVKLLRATCNAVQLLTQPLRVTCNDTARRNSTTTVQQRVHVTTQRGETAQL